MKNNLMKTSNRIQKSYTKSEFRTLKQLAVISAKIQLKRIEKGLNQKQFAKLMGVSQSMISKWESGEYNFSISTLTEICEKLNMEFTPLINDADYQISNDYKPIAIALQPLEKKFMPTPFMPNEVSA